MTNIPRGGNAVLPGFRPIFALGSHSVSHGMSPGRATRLLVGRQDSFG